MSGAPPAQDPSSSPWHSFYALEAGLASDARLLEKTRGPELRVLFNLVSSSQSSVLYAYSGNGKSSLVNAGLIPELQKTGYAVFRTRPRPPFAADHPSEAFKQSMLREVWLPDLPDEDQALPDQIRRELALRSDTAGTRLATLLDRLAPHWGRIATPDGLRGAFVEHMRRRITLPLTEYIREAQSFLGSQTNLVFVCDQFEELFVHYSNTPELREFVAAIGSVCADAAIRAQFVFSMREDWVGSLIEFREVIPEIFSNTFKLLPLKVSAAAAVLELPLEQQKIYIDKKVVQRIIGDLSQFYQVLQRQRYSRVQFSMPLPEDPFIELPALLLIAEKLWETRLLTAQMFSMLHYESLPTLILANHEDTTGVAAASGLRAGTENSDLSPARVVLETYLSAMLARFEEGDRSDKAENAGSMTDVRIDLLYALTDQVAHRKALSRAQLASEINRLRPASICAPVSDGELDAALRPLTASRLVRAEPSFDGGRQYELAHDFLVRSVVAEWQKQDRDRITKIAIEQRDQRSMTELKRKRVSALRMSLIAPGLLILSLVVSGSWAESRRTQRTEALQRNLDLQRYYYGLEYQLRRYELPNQPINDLLGQIGKAMYAEGASGSNEETAGRYIRDNASNLAARFGGRYKVDYPSRLVFPSVEPFTLPYEGGETMSIAIATGLCCLLVGWFAGIRTLVVGSGIQVLGSTVIWFATSSGMNWDGQWGWRMALAFCTVVMGLAAIGCALLDMFPGSGRVRRVRMFSADAMDGLWFVAIFSAVSPFGIGVLPQSLDLQMPLPWSMVSISLIWMVFMTFIARSPASGWRLADMQPVISPGVSGLARTALRQLLYAALYCGTALAALNLVPEWTYDRFGKPVTQLVVIFGSILVASGAQYLFREPSLIDMTLGITYTDRPSSPSLFNRIAQIARSRRA
jgi:hypothetical protein